MVKLKYDKLNIGNNVWFVIDFKKYAKFLHGEIVTKTDNELIISTFENGKNQGLITIYKGQSNAYIFKDKKLAWLTFVSLNYRGTDISTLDNQIQVDCKRAQEVFPELWI